VLALARAHLNADKKRDVVFSAISIAYGANRSALVRAQYFARGDGRNQRLPDTDRLAGQR